MEKKKKITIGIAIAIVAIIAVIVGIIVNNHQKAVKEAESISISVEVSRTDLIAYYKKQFDEITSKDYSTEEDYATAKALLESLKNDINNSDVKDDENIVNLINDIDKLTKDYDAKIEALTTTEESETETEEATSKSNSDDKGTKSNNDSNNGTNNSNNKKPKSTTTKEETKHETTTQKPVSNKKHPSNGTVVYSIPNWSDYYNDGQNWQYAEKTYEWEVHEYGSYWSSSTNSKMSAANLDKYVNNNLKEPDREGSYAGEKVVKEIWVWIE